jgi:hypothetical protein
MTEPHSPGQTTTGPPIPSQYQQAGGWPANVAPAAPKRNRGGLIAALVLVGVLVLCSGVAGTAIYVSTRQFGTGASSPDEAVTGYLTGVYLHQETSEAERYLCQQADPTTVVERKIKDARTVTDRFNASYSWTVLVVSNQTATEAIVSTDLSAVSGNYHTIASLTIRTINSDGWWVCDVKTSIK